MKLRREGVAELCSFLSVSSFLISFLMQIYYENFSSWLSPHKMFQLQHAHLRHILTVFYFIVPVQYVVQFCTHGAVVVWRWNCSVTIISSIAVFKIAPELWVSVLLSSECLTEQWILSKLLRSLDIKNMSMYLNIFKDYLHI